MAILSYSCISMYIFFYALSSFFCLRRCTSVARFLVSSIFFQVFISSCLSRAILFASSWASLSMLKLVNKKLDYPSVNNLKTYDAKMNEEIWVLTLCAPSWIGIHFFRVPSKQTILTFWLAATRPSDWVAARHLCFDLSSWFREALFHSFPFFIFFIIQISK